MQEISFEAALEKVLAKDPRYHRDAYAFVREALDYTQKRIGRANGGKLRHVTGQELLEGIREFALVWPDDADGLRGMGHPAMQRFR
jgi:hypothetical protein